MKNGSGGKSDFPVNVGNVSFLDGKPPQDVLRGVASSFIGEDVLNAAKARFNALLAAHGRPHGGRHVTTYFGMSTEDLLSCGDGILRRAPWFDNKGPSVVLEAHGHEIDGWWMQAASDVMLHVKFGHGLTVEETACILSGSPTPAADLVNYLRSHIGDERMFLGESVLSQLPPSLRPHLNASIVSGYRVARVSDGYWHGEDDIVFDVVESFTWKDCPEIEE